MEGRQPNRRGESLTPQQKRVFVAVCTLLLVLVAAVSTWGVTDPGSYGKSRHGCVNVTEPSSTGGAILHDCGAAARALCRRAFARHDRLSLLARPQCRLAGLAPGGVKDSQDR
jgi:hypothetical protein